MMNNQKEESNFWHMDGALKAQSSRMTVITIIAAIIALVAVAGMIAVWLQPPTVIRVLPDGEAKLVGPTGRIRDGLSPSLLSNVEAAEAPTPYEKEAYVRAFLTEYLNYDPHTLPANWSGALNMMTLNLRHAALDQFQAKDTVGTMEDEQARSQLAIKDEIEVDPSDPLTYNAFGIRTVHRMDKHEELVDELVEGYRIRLAVTTRSDTNPSGLLIAGFQVKEINSDTKQAVADAPAIGGGIQ
jgi:hypothetical protein